MAFKKSSLCEIINACDTVSEARRILQRRGILPPPPRSLRRNFYHPAQNEFLEAVRAVGKFSNCHNHLERAYTARLYPPDIFEQPMTEKWFLTQELERNSSTDDYLERILKGVFESIDYETTYIATNLDVDNSSGERAMIAGKVARDLFERNPISDRYGHIVFKIGAHPHEGFFTDGKIDKRKVRLYEWGCATADFCGGLPSRDGRFGGADDARFMEHMHIIFDTAKRLGKNLGVHVDQQNSQQEHEMLALTKMTKKYGMQGRVMGVHAVSLAAVTKNERAEIIAEMKSADVGLIVCPIAALSMKAPNEMTPTHNSIAPFPELMAAGIRLAAGSDNRADIYNPDTTGDMFFEMRVAKEASRSYDGFYRNLRSGTNPFIAMATAVPGVPSSNLDGMIRRAAIMQAYAPH